MTDRTRWDDRIASEDDVYDDASRHWDDDALLARLAEDAAELSAAASRAIDDRADPDAFIEELVDARVMIEQFARTYRRDRLETTVDERMDRLERMLEGGHPCPACDAGILEVSDAIYARCDDCDSVFGRDEVGL